jgi:hypothetical protein
MAAFTLGKQLPSLLESTKPFPVPDKQKNADQETKDKVPSDLDQLVPDALDVMLPEHPDNYEGQ